jgi:hypothetical protein
MTSDGVKTYAYDSENKAASVNGSAYHYDPLGRLAGAGSPLAIVYENYVDGLIAERYPGMVFWTTRRGLPTSARRAGLACR